MVSIAWAARHLVNALLNDAKALAHFLNVDNGAVIAVAGAADGDVEFELIVAGVGLLLAEVPFEAGSAKVRAGHAPFNCFVNGATAYALRAHFEKSVVHDGALVFVEARRHVFQEAAEHVVPSGGQVLCYSADAEPVRMHARTTDRFDNGKRFFAVIEHEEDR